MTDITESDIPLFAEKDVKIKDGIVFIDIAGYEFAKKCRQQILQNQKDAQEYRKIKDESIILNPNLLEKIELLQSQYKKLVDAIQRLDLETVIKNVKSKLDWFKEVEEDLEAYKIHSGISNIIQERIDDYRQFKNMYESVLAYCEQLQNLLKESEKE